MKNSKGFVMTETLVVTVFLVTIFTFIYVSIIPLIGKYEDKINRDGDIDIVYKLYNIRKMILGDANKNVILSGRNNEITCASFADSAYCNKLMEYLELTNYRLVYVDDIYENLFWISGVSSEMYAYISKYQNLLGKVLILYDGIYHTSAHLLVEN